MANLHLHATVKKAPMRSLKLDTSAVVNRLGREGLTDQLTFLEDGTMATIEDENTNTPTVMFALDMNEGVSQAYVNEIHFITANEMNGVPGGWEIVRM